MQRGYQQKWQVEESLLDLSLFTDKVFSFGKQGRIKNFSSRPLSQLLEADIIKHLDVPSVVLQGNLLVTVTKIAVQEVHSLLYLFSFPCNTSSGLINRK